jgi:hypothetical protein
MKYTTGLFIILALLVPTTSRGGDAEQSSDPLRSLRGYYATLVRTQMARIPLTFDPLLAEDPSRSAGDGTGVAVGASFTDFLTAYDSPIRDYLALDLEISSAEFSDDRVSNRKILFYQLMLEYGLIPVRTFPLVMYGCFGIKLRLVKNVVLKYDIKSGYQKWQELGDPVPGEPGWYYIERTGYTAVFRQISLGVTYIWNAK